MKLAEAKTQLLNLARSDLDPSERPLLNSEPPGADEGKFTLAGQVVRVVMPFSGFFPNVSPKWFEGKPAKPQINGEEFDVYAFFLRRKKTQEASYFFCSTNQMRSWTEEFIERVGSAHVHHADWRCDIHPTTARTGVFRWGDEDPSQLDLLPASRRIQLRNVRETIHQESGRAALATDTVERAAHDDPERWQFVVRRIRQGQPGFRKALLKAYESRCAISGHGPAAVLEAAHIAPHAETGRNDTANGLLLRADLHALFDDGLLRIDPDKLVVWLNPSLDTTPYSRLKGQRLRPRADGSEPDREALRARWE